MTEKQLLDEIRVWIKVIAWDIAFMMPFIILGMLKYLEIGKW